MTLTLELTPEEASQLEAARQAGIDIDTPLRETLRQILNNPKKPMTGAEALAFWKQEGVLGTFADRPDSQEFARELRKRAETRQRDTD